VGLATADALQVKLAHQPLHGAAGHGDPFAVQLPPHLAGAVDAKVLGVDPADLDLQLGVTDGSSRPRTLDVLVVGGRGDRQHLTDRLDPKAAL
jgi:hypothetical protein